MNLKTVFKLFFIYFFKLSVYKIFAIILCLKSMKSISKQLGQIPMSQMAKIVIF